MTVHPKAGALLKKARERAGLTQRQLAEALGVHPASVGLDGPRASNMVSDDQLPPLDPSGLVITLTIDYAEGRDDACRLVAATDADAEAMARLGVGRRVEARSAEFGCLLTLAALRRVAVLLRYDRKRRPCPVKEPARAKAKAKAKGKAAR